MKQGADLQSLVGYRVQRANLLMETDARAALAAHDLSPAKMTALILIRDNPGCDQTALGRALSINRSSAMKLVNILADKGLVERRPGRDLRTNALMLLPEGARQLEAMLAAVRQSDARMTQRLSAEELKTLRALLIRLGPAPTPEDDED
ncbi:MarR family transcriptional regulator [Sphingobium sp. Leaf26]|uniref:MarR family winged helix-turn-helix transcriptional regulator n=1 Tax=Sphingobium sp. Leaf26 TaxID=1735693 RepID=UPI000700FB0F|nr:MarR family transcriptional regulator [Sphingobium sp. Leaf26]KQN08013.1 MarR family transcriptional regulator [Sphingobium sp. Leaf26]